MKRLIAIIVLGVFCVTQAGPAYALRPKGGDESGAASALGVDIAKAGGTDNIIGYSEGPEAHIERAREHLTAFMNWLIYLENETVENPPQAEKRELSRLLARLTFLTGSFYRKQYAEPMREIFKMARDYFEANPGRLKLIIKPEALDTVNRAFEDEGEEDFAQAALKRISMGLAELDAFEEESAKASGTAGKNDAWTAPAKDAWGRTVTAWPNDISQILNVVIKSVGVPKERKLGERRVGITIDEVKMLVAKGIEVWIEKGTGKLSGIKDKEFAEAGAKIVSQAEVWEADLVKKVKEPLPQEYKYLRKGLILFTYLHLANPENKALTQALIDNEVTSIAYETVLDVNGNTPLLTPMSWVAGWIAPIWAAAQRANKDVINRKYTNAVDKTGLIKPELVDNANVIVDKIYAFLRRPGNLDKLKNGTLKFPPKFLKRLRDLGMPKNGPGKVVVLGGGNVGWEAAKMALMLGATKVVIADVKSQLPGLNERLKKFKKEIGSTAKVSAIESGRDENNLSQELQEALKQADTTVCGVYIRDKEKGSTRALTLLGEDILKQMRGIIVDVASDQGGNAVIKPGTEHTTHERPFALEYTLTCRVQNIPARFAEGISTPLLGEATMPVLSDLTDGRPIGEIIRSNNMIKTGVCVIAGKLIDGAVAEAHDMRYYQDTVDNVLAQAAANGMPDAQKRDAVMKIFEGVFSPKILGVPEDVPTEGPKRTDAGCEFVFTSIAQGTEQKQVRAILEKGESGFSFTLYKGKEATYRTSSKDMLKLGDDFDFDKVYHWMINQRAQITTIPVVPLQGANFTNDSPVNSSEWVYGVGGDTNTLYSTIVSDLVAKRNPTDGIFRVMGFESANAAGAAGGEAGATGLKVLFIENEDMVTKLYKAISNFRKWQPVFVGTTEAAKATLLQEDFDVVVIDLGIPGGRGGLDVIDAIRKMQGRKPRIIVSTGSSEPLKDLQEQGIPILRKPMSARAFISMVENTQSEARAAGGETAAQLEEKRKEWAELFVEAVREAVAGLELGQRLAIVVDTGIGRIFREGEGLIEEIEAMAAEEGFKDKLDIIAGSDSQAGERLSTKVKKYLAANENAIVRGVIRSFKQGKYAQFDTTEYRERVRLAVVDDEKIPKRQRKRLSYVPILPIVVSSLTGQLPDMPEAAYMPYVHFEEADSESIFRYMITIFPPAKWMSSSNTFWIPPDKLKEYYQKDKEFLSAV